MVMKNKEISEKFEIPLTKVRRYSKKFLPADPVAIQHSGKAREHSINDAFKIYLAEHLIVDMGFLTEQAQNIMHELGPWLEHNGFFPENAPGVVPVQEPTLIHIIRAGTPSGFFYKSVKLIHQKALEQDTIHRYERNYIEEDIMERPQVIDGINIHVLNISRLLEDFISKNIEAMQF
jgi:hypothetical protein